MINVDEIGLMNRRITLLAYTDVEDALGITHQKMTDVIGHPIWARVEPARGRTYYEQYKDKVELLTKITIRYRPGINEDMLVAYGGKQYKITSVIDPYDAHIKLELMCSLKRAGEEGNRDD